MLIKAQQSRDGGVMAGHYYPMAYVRDQARAVNEGRLDAVRLGPRSTFVTKGSLKSLVEEREEATGRDERLRSVCPDRTA